MQTWTDVTYKLGEKDHLMVCEHSDCVSLGLPGYVNSMEHGKGLYLYLTPAHLAELRQAVEALENIIANQQLVDSLESCVDADGAETKLRRPKLKTR